ncbi:MAG: hypothetical protein QM756_33940 [Polyangiaceae bacterium]
MSLIHNTHAHPIATLSGCQASFTVDTSSHAGEALLSYGVELVYTDHGGPAGEPPLRDSQGLRYDLTVP